MLNFCFAISFITFGLLKIKNMKKPLLIILLPALFVFGRVNGQNVSKPTIKIESAYKKGSIVYFTVQSNKDFYVGGNVYVLHIGDKQFAHSEQTSKADGSGELSFMIPEADFSTLMDGANVYVTYGQLLDEDDDRALAELSKQPTTQCWSIGQFNKKLLK